MTHHLKRLEREITPEVSYNICVVAENKSSAASTSASYIVLLKSVYGIEAVASNTLNVMVPQHSRPCSVVF